jgi:error-prone DNA polymerase
MTAKGIELEFAERVFEQIRGFGEYGFPESHAASFALIAYATAWMKCHYPEVFTCALLNAQPMGFYSPATIVEDAKRHGVEVRPVDIQASRWDCTLEPAAGGRYRFAVRMGLRYVKGLGKGQGERVEGARRERPFNSAGDFVGRTDLNDSTVTRLAEAGALAAFDSNRRAAIWRVKGRADAPPSSLALTERERVPAFEELDLFQTITWDYRTMEHSTRGHPLAALRKKLRRRRLPEAKRVHAMRDGEPIRYAGIVICRQRPGTASGVVFMTLEDETGFVNVVVWSRVFEEHMVLVKTSSFLGVTGTIQKRDGVVHVIAESFWDPQAILGAKPASGGSRDFH